jgi:hypothetical protein
MISSLISRRRWENREPHKALSCARIRYQGCITVETVKIDDSGLVGSRAALRKQLSFFHLVGVEDEVLGLGIDGEDELKARLLYFPITIRRHDKPS